MTIKIAGFWENSWQAPLNEYDLWIHPLREFDVDELHMVPITGISSSKSRVHEYSDLNEILEKFPDLPRIFVDEAAETSLQDFEHPKDGLYIFGKTSFAPYKIYARPEDSVVKFDTVTNGGGFWSHQCAAMILYDRFMKGM